jgi:hypothetical protein
VSRSLRNVVADGPEIVDCSVRLVADIMMVDG